MYFESRITWEKLALELDLLATETPHSLVPLLVGVNSLLYPEEDMEWCFRKINFMTYELIALAENYPEQDRLHILNDYFFDQKGFQISMNTAANSEELWLMKSVLTSRNGHILPIALLYLHLASHLDLPIYLVKLSQMSTLKWIRGNGKSNYLDLFQNGSEMDPNQVLRALNEDVSCTDDHCLDILPSQQIFGFYVSQLLNFFKIDENSEKALIMCDILLHLNNSSLEVLGDRAILRHKIGQSEQAMLDLKRYFSYVEKNTAPLELQATYRQLESLKKLSAVVRPDILH